MKNNDNKKIWIGIVVLILAVIVILLLVKGCGASNLQILFDTQGGTSISPLTVKKNDTIQRPADPTKEGYIFAGWYYNGELFDFSTKITKDMKLEARWTKADGSLAFKESSITIAIGEKRKLELSSLPDGIKASDLTWSSSDDSIVTVDQNGNIVGVKEGTVTITVRSGDYVATCTVTVGNVEVTGVSISGAGSVVVGNTIKLTANITPSNATNKKVTWTSSDPKIATVDANGNVKGLKVGTVTITVKTANGKTATKKITVTAAPKAVAVSKITITGNKEVYVGDTITLKATVSPSNATNKTVTWTSSNKKVATVDKNGKVTGISEGTVTITATAGGKKATYKVTVLPKYEIIMTALKQEMSVYQYRIVVQKNGKAIGSTEYKYITYNGYTYRLNTSDGNNTLPYNNVNASVKTAVIGLNNGKEQTATVIYK